MRSTVAWVMLFAPAVGAAPLECPEPSPPAVDAATGAPLVAVFSLRNAGGVPLRVAAVDAGCSCVRREVDRETLAPGESTELRVEVNTLQVPPGEHTWPVGVRYEAGGVPGRLELTLRARVRAEVTVKPASLAFSTAGAAERVVELLDVRPKPLKLLAARASVPFVAATADGNRVRVAVAADAPDGEHTATVTLVTDDPVRPELRLPVTVQKRRAGAVAAYPPTLNLRFAPGQTVLSGVVQLRGGARVAVASAESGDPAVSVVHSAVPGPVASLRVKVAPGRPAGEAVVRVKLAEPPGETVDVRVAWGPARD